VIPRCEDWRRFDSRQITPLVDAEAREWQSDLGWDVRDAWRAIEPARAAGHLPGLVVRGLDGGVAAWSCFLLHRHTLQVAMIVADAPENAAVIVEGILASPEAQRAATQTICIRDAAPGIRGVLLTRGFDVATYRYLRVPLDVPGTVESPCRPWEIEDAPSMSRLCARAYADTSEVRAFAPHGTLDEWHEYIATLVTGPGCGDFMRSASFTIPGRHPRRIEGGVITTALSPTTAHVAQVAVDPDSRGCGYGRALVSSAMTAAASAGYHDMTLLVAETNSRAASLYEDLGFVDRSTFVVAVRKQPRKLKRVTLELATAQ
jgi:ribosomal protein S18 acetylase RimI-like enzyme